MISGHAWERITFAVGLLWFALVAAAFVVLVGLGVAFGCWLVMP